MTEHSEGHRTRRLGRPPKPAEIVRSKRIVSFVTPSELEALEKISDHRGVSLSAVIHSMVVRSLDHDHRSDRRNTNTSQQRRET